MKIKKKSKRFNDAVKFIANLQFPRPLVRKTLDNLLQLYGGHWDLIEENGYQLMIECILDEIDTQNDAANIVESQFGSTSLSEDKEISEGNSKPLLENAGNQSGFKVRRLEKLKKLSSIGGLFKKGITTKSRIGVSATCGASSLTVGSEVNQSEANSLLLSFTTISPPPCPFYIEPPPLPSSPPPDLPPPPPESEYEYTSFNYLLANMSDQFIEPVAHYSCGSDVESCKPERCGGWLSWDD